MIFNKIDENSKLKSLDNSYSYEYIYQYHDPVSGELRERSGILIE